MEIGGAMDGLTDGGQRNLEEDLGYPIGAPSVC